MNTGFISCIRWAYAQIQNCIISLHLLQIHGDILWSSNIFYLLDGQTFYSVRTYCYSHTQPDFEQGPYGIKTVSTLFHPHRPALYPVSIPWDSATTIRRKKRFGSCSKKFARIAILYHYPYWTGSTRFNPQRKTASTLVACRMTFIVMIRIWSGWKWTKWLVFYATVTHSRISDRVQTELKPYRPGSTRIDPDPYWIKTVSTQFHPFRPCSTRIVTRVNSWGFWGL
jgi:hypothetical protein